MIRTIRHYLGNLIRETRLAYLRWSGIKIGRNTMISLGAKLDLRRGTTIIGDHCLITYGCCILSHDGAAKMIDPEQDGEGKVVIGNNVFIGVHSIILPNVTIGDNAVVAAGAVVTRDVAPATVVAGNPAREIKKLTGPFPILNQAPGNRKKQTL
ncbi:MAG: DapH/DapD/GlmU-related protein [Victivallaceae bacterium]